MIVLEAVENVIGEDRWALFVAEFVAKPDEIVARDGLSSLLEFFAEHVGKRIEGKAAALEIFGHFPFPGGVATSQSDDHDKTIGAGLYINHVESFRYL